MILLAYYQLDKIKQQISKIFSPLNFKHYLCKINNTKNMIEKGNYYTYKNKLLKILDVNDQQISIKFIESRKKHIIKHSDTNLLHIINTNEELFEFFEFNRCKKTEEILNKIKKFTVHIYNNTQIRKMIFHIVGDSKSDFIHKKILVKDSEKIIEILNEKDYKINFEDNDFIFQNIGELMNKLTENYNLEYLENLLNKYCSNKKT